MFQQLLVPLDGSALAERALPCAQQVALATGAALHLVRVTEPPPDPSRMVWVPDLVGGLPTGIYDDLVAAEIRQATLYLDKVRERAAAAGGRVRVAHLTGHVASALLDYERDAGIDLVVMCSHGRSGLARFAVGSVADRLLRHGIAPVMLVRAYGDAVTLEHAIVPLDGSERAEAALRVISALAGSVVHEVTLLRLTRAQDEGPEADRYLREVAERLQAEHLLCVRRVEQGDPVAAIIAVAGATKLVVITTQGRSGLARWALDSSADRVLRGGVAGILLLRADAVPASQHPDDTTRRPAVASV